MKRKVMKIGPATLVVSLPAGSVRKFGIEKGDELEVIEHEKGIQITTKKEFGLDKKEINISEYNPIIMRAIGMLYKAGYNEIRIKYDENKKSYRGKEYNELDLIKRAVESYSGVDIKEIKKDKSQSYVTIIERAHLMPAEFKNTLNQAFLHLSFISEEVYDCLLKNNTNAGEKINLADNLINQTTNFCQKVLNKSGYEQFNKTTFIYMIVAGIERLGDKYRELYGYFSKANFKSSKEILKIYSGINEALNDFYSLYRKFDIKRLAELGDKCQGLMAEADKLTAACAKKEIKALFYLENIITEIYDLLEPLMAFYHEELN